MPEAYAHNALPPGTLIQEYRIREVLGAGSFGIVYKAENVYLDEVVAIKEFLPGDLACRTEGTRVVPLSSETEEPYGWALRQFLKEAQILWNLARPERHPNIVRVSSFREGNGTAYMVMEFEEGKPLSKILDERGTLPESELRQILDPLLDGLERVHAASVWHRDIKPANILVRPDGSPVLIDFGAARQERADRARSLMAMYSPAYAAPEQVMAMGEQGPWTDIYSLGATLYRAVTGKPPTGVSERALGAPHVPASEAGRGSYSPTFLAAIDTAMALPRGERPQSIAAWRRLFIPAPAPATPPPAERTVIHPAAAPPGLATAPELTVESLAPEAILPAAERPASRASEAAAAGARRPRRAWLWAIPVLAVGAGAAVYLLRPMGPPSSPPTTPSVPEPVAPALAPSTEPPSTEQIIAELQGRPERPSAAAPYAVAPLEHAEPPPVPPPPVVSVVREPPTAPPTGPVATEPPGTPKAEPVALTGALPASVRPAPFDPVAITAEVDQALTALDCAVLRSTVAPDRRVFVSGYVASAADVGRVQTVLRDIPRIEGVVADVKVLERPFCELLDVVERHAPPAGATDRGPGIKLNRASASYREGEFLVVEATAGQAFDGYLYVDYIDSAGALVHMLPSPARRNNAVRAGQRTVIGTDAGHGAGTTRQYEIVPPHGRGMIIAVQSRRPLFERERPEEESVAVYLPALKGMLERAGATDVLASSVFLTTRP